MNEQLLHQQTPVQIAQNLAATVRARRKEHGYSQIELSKKANVSLGSLNRFEAQYEISLKSLIKLAIALDCEDDFLQLFARKHYQSIQEVIAEQNA
jgi:transcriptional regulator with XRE-family HTH domain